MPAGRPELERERRRDRSLGILVAAWGRLVLMEGTMLSVVKPLWTAGRWSRVRCLDDGREEFLAESQEW